MKPKTGTRIGLVDDDEMVRIATGVLLEFHGFDVHQFDSAESLLAAGALQDFDCLIVDYRMAGMTGLELLRELRRSGNQVPAIVVSGYTTAADTRDLMAAGAVAIMEKPVRPDEFVAALVRITDAERGHSGDASCEVLSHDKKP